MGLNPGRVKAAFRWGREKRSKEKNAGVYVCAFKYPQLVKINSGPTATRLRRLSHRPPPHTHTHTHGCIGALNPVAYTDQSTLSCHKSSRRRHTITHRYMLFVNSVFQMARRFWRNRALIQAGAIVSYSMFQREYSSA